MSEQRGSDVDLAIAAAEAGAAVVRAKYGASVGRHDKSATDFATDADLAAEQAILNLIHQARPADAIVGEEYGASGDADAPRRWLVDPLCGTLNFAAQTPLFSVNVALQVDGEASVAAAADPMSGETFWTDGRTASVRRGGSDVPLTPSAGSRLVDVNLDPITDGDFLGSRLLTDDTFRKTFGQRVLSTTLAVAWVAAGRRAAYVTDGNLRDSVHFTACLALCSAGRLHRHRPPRRPPVRRPRRNRRRRPPNPRNPPTNHHPPPPNNLTEDQSGPRALRPRHQFGSQGSEESRELVPGQRRLTQYCEPPAIKLNLVEPGDRQIGVNPWLDD